MSPAELRSSVKPQSSRYYWRKVLRSFGAELTALEPTPPPEPVRTGTLETLTGRFPIAVSGVTGRWEFRDRRRQAI